MTGIKELKNRIRSIGSTRKITRAMQLVSAAKMRKAQNATLQSRSYASLAWEMVESLGYTTPPQAVPPSLSRRGETASKIGIVLLTSNRGLVGSLNANLMGQVKEINGGKGDDGRKGEMETIAELITYGKKAQVIAARLKKDIVADFPKFDRTISIEDIYPIAKFISDAYNIGKYEKIVIVYNHFVSTLSQKATIKQLLPFSPSLPREGVSRSETEGYTTSSANAATPPLQEEKTAAADYLFEPDPQTVINHLIPRIIESQIYQAILESDASEHSARMVMMKNATEAAEDLISDLTLTYNQLRQNKITTELAEITAGKIALE